MTVTLLTYDGHVPLAELGDEVRRLCDDLTAIGARRAQLQPQQLHLSSRRRRELQWDG